MWRGRLISRASSAGWRPSRGQLPPLSKYAHLQIAGESRPAGYIEASRGCLHYCRHCPIPPVYEGRFFVVPLEVVLAGLFQEGEPVARDVVAEAHHAALPSGQPPE